MTPRFCQILSACILLTIITQCTRTHTRTVNSAKLCPDGWRVPTDNEWKQIEGFADTKYGIGDSVWNKVGLRGFEAGQRLKAVSGWRQGMTGTDSLGFSSSERRYDITPLFRM